VSDSARFILSDHARDEIIRRDIPELMLRAVIENPEPVLPVRLGRVVM
jgi:hypothetical protein